MHALTIQVVSESNGRIVLFCYPSGGATPTFGDDQCTALIIFQEEKLRDEGKKVHMGLTHLLGKA